MKRDGIGLFERSIEGLVEGEINPEVERWQRIREVFHRALEVESRERGAWVSQELAQEPSEREQVLALLAAADEAGDFLEEGGVAAAPVVAEIWRNVEDAQGEPRIGQAPGQKIGPYRLLEEIGRGGMGSVYLAVRDDGSFEQRVAIKLIRRGMDTEDILRRFLVERQILAHLNHPNIARLLDGGSTEEGRPFFVLEHILGRPITEHCRAERLDLEARLRLFLAVADAVDFAHQRLVVHRDLKPANILVDADGVPKLLDFGIAKMLAPRADLAAATVVGSRPRTPDYASPEQIAGGVITTASDVHGLGLLLFELLTGALPVRDAHGLAPLASRSVRAREAAGELGALEARRLARRLAGDLDTLLAKALAPDPARRYASARDFALDVERYLAKRPIAARRPTVAYRLGSFVRRRKLAATAASVVFALLLVAAVQAVALARERAQVIGERQRAENLSSFLIDVFKVADPGRNRGETVTVRALLDAAARQLSAPSGGPSNRGLAAWLPERSAPGGDSPQSRADLLDAVGEVYTNLGLYTEAEEVLKRALELRGLESGREAALGRTETWRLLAVVRRAQGNAASARRLLDAALAGKIRLLGARSLAVARCRREIGLVEVNRSNYLEAAAEFEQAIESERAAGAEGRLDLAESLSALATLEILRERPQAAAARIAESRALHRELVGQDHPQSADDLVNLAGLYYRSGEYDRADRCLREALALRRRLFGPQHPDVAEALISLSAISDKRGDREVAERQARAALAIFETPGLATHPSRPAALNNLAAILAKAKKLDEAEQVYRQAIVFYQANEGASSSNVANCLNNLAQVRRDRGDLDGAESLFRRAREMWRQALGSDSAAVATATNGLAATLALEGRLDEAEREFRHALALRRKVLPAGHPDLAFSLVGLGEVLVERGRAVEGEPLLRDALLLRRRALPAGHWLIDQAESSLAKCLAALARR